MNANIEKSKSIDLRKRQNMKENKRWNLKK